MTDNRFTPGLVSVVIPSYGCANTIAAVLDGVFNQTYQSLEVLVVNDCSPDHLEEAVKPFLSRIRYLVNKTNLGLSKTYNVGLRQAHGEYVLTLHSDCVLDADYVARLIEHMEKEPSLAAVTGQYRFENFRQMSLSDKLFTVLNLLPVTDRDPGGTLQKIAFIEGKADLFRAEILHKYGLFNENLRLTCEDQDLSVQFRRDGYTIAQDSGCRFTVKFTATQDSIKKVLNKQRTYARGQANVLLRYGRLAFLKTTRNRDRRILHRASQVLWVLALLAAALATPTLPFAAWAFLVLLAARMAYYFWIASNLEGRERLAAAGVGVIGDFHYVFGLAEGTVLTIVGGRG